MLSNYRITEFIQITVWPTDFERSRQWNAGAKPIIFNDSMLSTSYLVSLDSLSILKNPCVICFQSILRIAMRDCVLFLFSVPLLIALLLNG